MNCSCSHGLPIFCDIYVEIMDVCIIISGLADQGSAVVLVSVVEEKVMEVLVS